MSRKLIMASRSESVKNIVLVGRTGNGKSATGNSLIRKHVFPSEQQAAGVTMKCKTFRAVTKSGPIINVIDTPGLFDLMASADFISNEIVRCLALAKEGLHAVVLVLSVRNRISKEEEDTLCTLQMLFGSRILDYLIVVFTGGDELESNKQTLDKYLERCPEFLMKVFRLCGNRRVLFDNRTTNENKMDMQIEELLENVAAIEEVNSGIPFTDETHRMIKEETDKLIEKQRVTDARKAARAEIEQMKKQLQKSYDSKMKQMAVMVENALTEAWHSHQRMLQVGSSSTSSRQQVIMSPRRQLVVSPSRQLVMSTMHTESCNIL